MSQTEFSEFIVRAGLTSPLNGQWRWLDIERAMDALRDEPDPAGVVYFIGFAHWVKIGFTTNLIRLRMSQIQNGAPERLRLYAQMSGTRETEADLHHRFSAYRTHGEWFRHEDELAAYIRSLPPVDSGHG